MRFIQDMPPAGGYGNINYERQIPKKPMGCNYLIQKDY